MAAALEAAPKEPAQIPEDDDDAEAPPLSPEEALKAAKLRAQVQAQLDAGASKPIKVRFRVIHPAWDAPRGFLLDNQQTLSVLAGGVAKRLDAPLDGEKERLEFYYDGLRLDAAASAGDAHVAIGGRYQQKEGSRYVLALRCDRPDVVVEEAEPDDDAAALVAAGATPDATFVAKLRSGGPLVARSAARALAAYASTWDDATARTLADLRSKGLALCGNRPRVRDVPTKL